MNDAYALISRVHDPSTGRLAVVIAGVSPYGTRAAGEFVTGPGNFAEVLKQAQRNWAQKNLQIVIKSEIVDGSLGPPRVIASYAW
jgi:hypothetical protein